MYKSKDWLNALKVAILNKNQTKSLYLIENLPEFNNLEEMISARELVLQVLEWLKCEKKELGFQMEKIEAQKRFLH